MKRFTLKYLETKLAEGNLSEKEGWFFLLANWIVFGSVAMLVIDSQHDNPGVMGMMMILSLAGLLVTWRANSKGDGKDYLKRFVVLHFSIGVRFMVLTILLAFPASKLISLIDHVAVKGFVMGGYFMIMGIAYYYTLARSFKRVSGQMAK